jgi:PmbA protein
MSGNDTSLLRLLELASKVADQAAIYSRDSVSDGVTFADSRLKDIDSGFESGVNLLLLKDGKLGYSYTRNLVDPEGLVQDVLASLRAGPDAGFDLPEVGKLPRLDTFDPGIEQASSRVMVEECERVCGILAARTRAQANAYAMRDVTTIRVLNSRCTDLSATFSFYASSASVVYPGTYAGVARLADGKTFVSFPGEELDFIADVYNRSGTEVKPGSGPKKMLFVPETFTALVSRLTAGTNGKSVYEKVSPLRDKLGAKVFSDKVTITDEPLNDSVAGARSFDDEATPCRNLPVVENGVLKSFYTDRFYAWKLGLEPNGHGFRPGVGARAVPALDHLRMKPGTSSFADMVRMMDEGIIVCGVMGAHSGNILNGDFSVGISPGLYVKSGEIVGRVKDAMAAGNVYDTLNRVIAVEDKLHTTWMGRFPAVLLDNVSFAAQA